MPRCDKRDLAAADDVLGSRWRASLSRNPRLLESQFDMFILLCGTIYHTQYAPEYTSENIYQTYVSHDAAVQYYPVQSRNEISMSSFPLLTKSAKQANCRLYAYVKTISGSYRYEQNDGVYKILHIWRWATTPVVFLLERRVSKQQTLLTAISFSLTFVLLTLLGGHYQGYEHIFRMRSHRVSPLMLGGCFMMLEISGLAIEFKNASTIHDVTSFE